MARLNKTNLSAGSVTKPATLSARASCEWDRLMSEFKAAGIPLAGQRAKPGDILSGKDEAA